MTKFCPPGHRPLADVRDELGADILHSQLASKTRLAVAWDPREGTLKPVNPRTWLVAHADGHIARGTIKPYPFAPHDLVLLIADESPGASPTRSAAKKGGRPPSADWEALEEALKHEIAERGLPDPLNVDGWQRQSDVESWLALCLQREGNDVADSTIRDHARDMLSKLKGENLR